MFMSGAGRLGDEHGNTTTRLSFGRLEKFPEWKINFLTKEKKYWEMIFDRVHANEIDTWDYYWVAVSGNRKD